MRLRLIGSPIILLKTVNYVKRILALCSGDIIAEGVVYVSAGNIELNILLYLSKLNVMYFNGQICQYRECAPKQNCRPIIEWGMREAVRHCKLCYR